MNEKNTVTETASADTMPETLFTPVAKPGAGEAPEPRARNTDACSLIRLLVKCLGWMIFAFVILVTGLIMTAFVWGFVEGAFIRG